MQRKEVTKDTLKAYQSDSKFVPQLCGGGVEN